MNIDTNYKRPLIELPERVVDKLLQAAGVSTCHPSGDQQEELYVFAQNVINEALARLPGDVYKLLEQHRN